MHRKNRAGKTDFSDLKWIRVEGYGRTLSGMRGNEWQKNVMDEARIVSAKVIIPSSGYHTLKVWMVDPGITLQKVFIDLGGLKQSYLGPPESYNRPLSLSQKSPVG